MAERRMFTQKITESDQFTTLPPTTQCLYFHLCMNADDDGFSNKIRHAMFNAHADQNDFNLLVQHRFIIPFESGVIVIKHWKMHNLIRNDRYHETDYIEEKATLVLKENGVYTDDLSKATIPMIINDNQVTTKRQPSDNQVETEDRLGKVSKGKDNIDTVNYQKIIDAYNDICKSLPRVTKITEGRKRQIRIRLKTYSEAEMIEAFKKAEKSDFLKGSNGRWKCNFDWLMKNDENMSKVIDGNYKNQSKKGGIEINEEYRDSIQDIIKFETV